MIVALTGRITTSFLCYFLSWREMLLQFFTRNATSFLHEMLPPFFSRNATQRKEQATFTSDPEASALSEATPFREIQALKDETQTCALALIFIQWTCGVQFVWYVYLGSYILLKTQELMGHSCSKLPRKPTVDALIVASVVVSLELRPILPAVTPLALLACGSPFLQWHPNIVMTPLRPMARLHASRSRAPAAGLACEVSLHAS